MKVSVVMTTYNGEKYVYEQLNSIYKQTISPNEVIICDDRSSDKTVSIVNDFIEKNNLVNWSCFVNSENKGWQQNFIDLMGNAKGDVLFLCDQDDIWINDKIEVMLEAIKSNDQIKCLSGKMLTIDGNGQTISNKHGYSLGNNTNEFKKIPFTKRFNTTTILGCTMCVTKDVVEVIKDLDVKKFSHDAQTCRLATLLDGMYLLDRPVIKYRIHNNNTSGISAGVGFGSSILDKRINSIKENIHWLETLLNYYHANNKLPDYKLDVVDKTKEMQERRYEFLTSKKVGKYIGLFKYKNYYSNISMLLGDFAYCYGINKLAGKVRGSWMMIYRGDSN